ncbi:myeloid differentiation primary response protein MyD88-like [Mizuhopecten yessoensis]|uniref:Myeloid differentiation primary response protein MyD88 n=1 Tax=Mizuhopecten yessoensis TaxID=6573 RepID=A0A210QLG9_MIZYE|nr:myeloid differentiation primary response protein MyD88-like [Mizuhopecten yessoensis]OWF49576.1 Myeloid differentiation primary response protein MyD88 [Mizuhopecten yessoensis]
MPDNKITKEYGKRCEVKHNYDAYVSHGSSDRDRQFVRMLANILEQEPFNFHLFLPDENLIDKDNNSIISETIKHKCNRLLLVMSKDYAVDKMSDFTVNVALDIPNCRRDRKIIPVIIDRQCGLPVMINHLTSADFTIPEALTWVLPRLCAALRAPISKPSQIKRRTT